MTTEYVADPMSDEVMSLLRQPNFAHLATLLPDGAPKLDPVWIDVLDEHTLVVGTGRATIKARNVMRDPRVAVSVLARDDPYEEAQLRGYAVIEDDPEMTTMDRISRKYIGEPFPMRAEPHNRVAIVITVTQSRYTRLPFEQTPPDVPA